MQPTHFNAVFDSIDSDNSGFINRGELKELFRRFNVPCSEEDVALMIEVCSTDGQKIRRRDLEQFLRN
jgi:Ca2+-binding EF-hand superfamily protein